MELNVAQNAEYVLTRLGTVIFSRMTLFHVSYIPCPVLSTFTGQAIFLLACCTDPYFYDNTENDVVIADRSDILCLVCKE